MSGADLCSSLRLANKQPKPGKQGLLAIQLLERFYLVEELSVTANLKRLHKLVYISQMIKNSEGFDFFFKKTP